MKWPFRRRRAQTCHSFFVTVDTAPSPRQWGEEIEIDGVRPSWLADDDMTTARSRLHFRHNGVWPPPALSWKRAADVENWSAVTHLRLEAGHPHYAGRQQPKPRIRIRADGWVRVGANGFPFNPGCLVETMHWNGAVGTGREAEYAEFWPDSFWRGKAHRWGANIAMYRIIGAPAEGIAAPAVRVLADGERP